MARLRKGDFSQKSRKNSRFLRINFYMCYFTFQFCDFYFFFRRDFVTSKVAKSGISKFRLQGEIFDPQNASYTDTFQRQKPKYTRHRFLLENPLKWIFEGVAASNFNTFVLKLLVAPFEIEAIRLDFEVGKSPTRRFFETKYVLHGHISSFNLPDSARVWQI